MSKNNVDFAIENIDNLKKEYNIFAIFKDGYKGKIISRFSDGMVKTTFILNFSIEYKCCNGFGYDCEDNNIKNILKRIFNNTSDHDFERDNFNWMDFLNSKGYIVYMVV